MAPEVPQRPVRRAIAVLVGCLLLAFPATASASAAGDRPPSHAAGREDPPPSHAPGHRGTPPPHAHAPAPEARPPAHAHARRASARHATDGGQEERTTTGGRGDPPERAPGTGEPRHGGPAGGPGRPGARPATPSGPRHGPPDGAPAHGRRLSQPDTDAPATDTPTTGPGTDPAVEGPAPQPDRSPTGTGAPVLPVPPPAAPRPGSVLGAGVTAPLTAVPPTGDTGTPGPDAGDDVALVADGEPPGSRGDRRAAPRRSVPSLFPTPELTTRVVVPVVLLVAGLLYLLAQGRIDRRGELLLAPVEPGAERDDDVFEL